MKPIKGCPEKKIKWTRSCPCTAPDLTPCRQQYRKPKEAPLCWGTYKDNQKCCQNCRVLQGCAEEMVLAILEGRNQRPSAIIELKNF